MKLYVIQKDMRFEHDKFYKDFNKEGFSVTEDKLLADRFLTRRSAWEKLQKFYGEDFEEEKDTLRVVNITRDLIKEMIVKLDNSVETITSAIEVLRGEGYKHSADALKKAINDVTDVKKSLSEQEDNKYEA